MLTVYNREHATFDRGNNDWRKFRPLEIFSDPLNIYGPSPGYLSLIGLVDDKPLNLNPIHVWSCPVAESVVGCW